MHLYKPYYQAVGPRIGSVLIFASPSRVSVARTNAGAVELTFPFFISVVEILPTLKKQKILISVTFGSGLDTIQWKCEVPHRRGEPNDRHVS